VYVAAASNALWNNRTACGKTLLVNCIGGTNLAPQPCSSLRVFMKIVDYCPRCGATINLSRDAFAMIANPDSGKIKMDYVIE
jgi:ribosomal protein S27AE